MAVHAFFAHYCRAINAPSVFLALLLLLPSFSALAQPSLQSARLVKPHASPKATGKAVEQLRVGDVIPARSNATGKLEWRQVIHASKRMVPSLLSVQLTNAKTGKPVETLTCPLDQSVTLSGSKSVPAGRLSVGNCIITRAGPVCKVKALFLLRKPGGFVLCDVRVGPLSAAKAKLLALSQVGQARSNVRFADYKIPASRVSYATPASTSSGIFNPFLFQGQQYDPANGNYYLRARYYDPTMGRFLSPDPFDGLDADPNSLHRYLYASNDPVNRVDPSGEDDFSLGGQLATEGVAATEDATLSPAIAKSLAYAGARANLINARSTITLAAVAAGYFLGATSDTKDPEQRQVLFHYTSAVNAASIAADGATIATPQFNPTLPSGAYASDISPIDPGWTQKGLSRLFYGDNPTHDTSWYVEIDNGDPYLGGFRPLIYQGHPHFFVKDFPAGLPVPVKVLSIRPNPMPLGQ